MDMHCRTCFQANGSRRFDISAISQVSDERISDMLIYCLQIEISPYDMLPQKICETCLSTLNSMFLFRKNCYHSDTELRKMLNFAPPEHHSPVLNMDLELNLVDAQLPVQNFKREAIDLEPDEGPVDSDSYEQSPPKSQEILATENSTKLPYRKPVANPKRRHKSYECEQCDYKSSYKCNIIRHQESRDHTGWRITFPDGTTAPQEIPSANSSTEGLDVKPVVVEKYLSKLFECEQCDYRSSVKCNINRHQQCRNHTGIRISNPSEKAPLKAVKKLQRCHECGFQTFILSKFRLHQRVSKHTSYTTLDVEVKRVLEKCPTCPHCGVQRANLQAHMAQWCRVLLAKKRQDIKDGTTSYAMSANETTEECAPSSVESVDLKIEIDSS